MISAEGVLQRKKENDRRVPIMALKNILHLLTKLSKAQPSQK
jgi:hypothetical protein